MANANKIVYLDRVQGERRPTVIAGKHEAEAKACKSMMLQTIQPLVQQLFAQADDDFFRLAENSTSNTRQTLFFDAMRSLRLFRERAEKAYLQMFAEAYDAFWKGEAPAFLPATVPDSEQKEFSLVETDELEEQLAVSSMASKAADQYHRELQLLDACFAYMRGEESIAPEENPVGPSVLSGVFRAVLDEWDTQDVLARIVVYKCFEKCVMNHLSEGYQRTLDYLAERSVLKQVKTLLASGKPAGPSAQRSSSQEENQGGAEGKDGQPDDQSVTPSMQTLWQHVVQHAQEGLGQPLHAGPANANLPVLPTDRVMETLNNLQHVALANMDLESKEWALFQERIRQQLSQTLYRDEAGEMTYRFGEAEQQTIDVIMALFDHVLDDPNLPDAMRVLIARLQIPVLKAAIADASFVDNKQHPARRLLDVLAEASVGWRDDGDRSEKSLYFQVKQAVDRIVHDYDEDLAVFEQVYAEFTNFMEQRARVKQMLEKRLTQVASGEEKLELAKHQVEELFEELDAHRLPQAAWEILDQPWRKLLTILLLREGEEGSNWRKAVNVAKLLTNYLANPPQSVDRQKLLSSIPEIISGLKIGFSYISQDQKKSAAMLNALQSLFIGVLKQNPRGAEGMESSVNQIPAEGRDTLAERKEPKETPKAEKVEDEYDRCASNLKEGGWIRLRLDAEKSPLICKLVWRSRFTGTMVFVDGQGNKAAQLKEVELAAYFRDGSAELVEEVKAPLIDRTINRMMKVLSARVVGPRLQFPE